MDKIYYELIWLFFWYGFLGCGLEVAVAAIKKRKFANKGLINGPFSVRYAIARPGSFSFSGNCMESGCFWQVRSSLR